MGRFYTYIFFVILFSILLAPRALSAFETDGFSEPYREIKIASAESGTLEKIEVSEGDRVKTGQVLAILDCDVLRTSLEISNAKRDALGKIQSLEAELNVRQSRFDKLKELQKTGNARPEELERAEADAAIAKANLGMAKEDRYIYEIEGRMIEAQIERRTFRSPIDGIVSAIKKDVRENVTAGDAHILTVVQINPLRVTVYIPAEQAAYMKNKDKVKVKFTDTEEEVEGTVDFVSPVVDPQSATVCVKILIDNPDEKYRSGVRCKVEL